MDLIYKNKGFNVIELLIIAGVVSILVVMAGALSSKFADRRSVDSLAHKITSNLNLVKLQSSRNGVEYQAVINFNDTEKKLTMTTQMGDSNRNSTTFETQYTEEINVFEEYEIVNSDGDTDVDIVFNFNPNNTLGSASGRVEIKPVSADARVLKCAEIVVSPFGRIRTIFGRWDFGTSECRPIFDEQELPS